MHCYWSLFVPGSPLSWPRCFVFQKTSGLPETAVALPDGPLSFRVLLSRAATARSDVANGLQPIRRACAPLPKASPLLVEMTRSRTGFPPRRGKLLRRESLAPVYLLPSCYLPATYCMYMGCTFSSLHGGSPRLRSVVFFLSFNGLFHLQGSLRPPCAGHGLISSSGKGRMWIVSGWQT